MNIAEQIQRLPPKEQRGSRVRCLLLTEESRTEVAQRLSALAAPFARVDPERHHWLPQGLCYPKEAKLGETPDLLIPEHREALTDWWLAVRSRANTPNWGLASTATVNGREGLVLVEAKAHTKELKPDGKSLDASSSENSLQNHQRITACIREANDALNGICPGWNLTTTSHYQLANRFAWSWKIALLGIPVVLVYLGFLEANEMVDVGAPLEDADAWEKLVRHHGQGIVPDVAWDEPMLVGDVPLHACIRSFHQPLLPSTGL